MSINSSFFMSAFNFDVTVKSLLLGFTRKENVKVTGCTNVVVFGTTEASAQAYVANVLKGVIPDNVQCAGVDSVPSHYAGKGFSGYIVMLPELRFVSAEFFDKIVDVVEMLKRANCGEMSNHEYKDLEILFGNRDIEAAFFGSTFERWKTEKERHHDWHIYGEIPKYSRNRLDSPTIFAQTPYLGEEKPEFGEDEPAPERQIEPYVLAWDKVVLQLLAEGREGARVTHGDTHPVRFGPEFAALSPHMLYTAINKFTFSDMIEAKMAAMAGNTRIICVHDSLALILFTEQIRPHLAVGDQYVTESGVTAKAVPFEVELRDLM